MGIVVTFSLAGGPLRSEDFDKDEVSIGRGAGNDIVLPRESVAPRHCRLGLRDGKLILINAGLTRATSVNGRLLTHPQVLRDGDTIEVGEFTLRAAMSGDALNAPPSSSDALQTPPRGVQALPVAEPGHAGPAIGVFKDGEALGAYQLTRAVIAVGRHPQNDLVLEDRAMSRFHCRLEQRAAGWFVVDCGSQGGVRVNNIRITGEQPLANDAIIAAGGYQLRFHAAAPAARAPSGPPAPLAPVVAPVAPPPPSPAPDNGGGGKPRVTVEDDVDPLPPTRR